MAGGIDAAMLALMRGGAIPLLCGGATCCFAVYSVKVASAATQWRRLELPVFDRTRCSVHAGQLDEHFGGCLTLTLASAATTVEAAIDHRVYRAATPDEIASFFLKATPFFLRPSVLGTAAAALLASVAVTGGCRFVAPRRPPVLLAHGSIKSHDAGPRPQPQAAEPPPPPQAEEPPPHVVAPTDSAAAIEPQSPSGRVRWPQTASLGRHGDGPSGYELMCDALAKRLAACEQSNTPRTRFHCDPQRERWHAACGEDRTAAARA